MTQATTPARVTIPGHVIPALHGLRPTANLPASRKLQLSIGLNLRNRAGLDALLHAQNDAKSGIFHHFLTPQQFTDQFGPLPATTNAVTTFLRGQGFQVTSIASNRALIFAAGTVEQIEHAFDLTLANFAYGGRTIYAPLNDPSVPTALGGAIQSIVGLDDVLQFRHSPHKATPRGPGKISPQGSPSGCSNPGFGYADFEQAYDLSTLYSVNEIGTNQTIAIPEFDGYAPWDIGVFNACYTLPTLSYTCTYVAGPPTCSSPNPKYELDAFEADLDMEVAYEIAPGATEAFYLGTGNDEGSANGYVPTLYDINQVYNQIVSNNTATIVSNSWFGGCEANLGSSGSTSADLEQEDVILAQGASQGMAFFVASGDTGSECDNTTSVNANVDDPYVVGVGGTVLTNNGGTYSEGAWSGSGGGRSIQFQTPAYQAQNSDVASVVNGHRGVPDVSANAVNFAVYCSVQATDGTCPGFTTETGTSGATPLWAGIAADINQYLLQQGKATLGTASELLYEVYAKEGNGYAYAFHDIADGTSNGANTAGPGYDLVTGMGSPDAWVLASDLDDLIQTNLESDVVWGQTQTDIYQNCTTSTVDLMAAYNQSSSPGWQKPIDVFTSFSNNVSGDPCPNLVKNAGQPAIVSYPTQGDGTEVDVFALATDKNSSTPYIHGFIYLPASGTWTNLGPISQAGSLQPEFNPAMVAEHTAPTTQPNQSSDPTVALFGISSTGHLVEYYLTNSIREDFGDPQLFNYRDLSSVTGVSGCDPTITPAPVIYNTVPVVFADCNQELIEFYDNTNGQWRANTGLVGHDIPNASEAFPHHSIAAMVVPSGSPGALEAYVASDQNGVSALSEYLYDGSAWHAYAVPTGGYTPDQVYAQTVIQADVHSATTISDVIAPEPATVSCSVLSYAMQHVYVSGGWQTTSLPSPGITTMQANESEYGTVLTEAYTGGYYGPAGFGSEGGGGCANPGGAITEDGSTLATSGSQSWWWATVDASGVDNAGVEPVTTAFPY